jgi:hypothetical protein
MFVRPRFPRHLVFILIAVAGAGRAGAQLAAASPFLPVPTTTGTATPTMGAPLEFRGLADTVDGVKFRVVDTGPKKSGTWVRLNERDPDLGVIAKKYDAAGEMLTVEYQGRTLTLALHEAKVTSGGVAVPNMPMVQAVNPQPFTGSNIVIGPPNPVPTNQNQLDAIAADVARRRALREQAAQPAGQGVVIAPQLNQQPPQNQNGPRGQLNNQIGPRGQQGGRNRGMQSP